MVYPILLNAIPLPDGERPTSNYTLKTNFNLKVLDFVQLGGAYPTLYLLGFSTPSDVPFSLTTYTVGNQHEWDTPIAD